MLLVADALTASDMSMNATPARTSERNTGNSRFALKSVCRSVGKQLLRRRNLEAASAVLLSFAIIYLLQSRLQDSSDQSLANASAIQADYETGNPDAIATTTEAFDQRSAKNSRHERLSSATIVEQLPFTLDDELQSLLLKGDVDHVTDDLLLKSSEAVANGDYAGLGRNIALLGSVTLLQRDTEGAAVYLQEALAIFEQEEDELGIAGVELLHGQLNIEKRWQAREAAYAYDAMQIAGWKIAHDRFPEAEVVLEQTIESNLELNRYSAAAAGYEALYRGYNKNGLYSDAMNAGTEAAKLHAASGRNLKANQILDGLDELGLDAESRRSLQAELRTLQIDYENSINQIGNAENYAQLYHHYINQGDPVRAWQFRLQSRQSLDGVSKRAMHRRQTGVIALLFTSNDHMKKAAASLARAEQVFNNHDAGHLQDLSDALKKRIY